MVITFYGEGCFKVQSGEFVILTDPFDEKLGLTVPRFKSDIALKTLTSFPIANQPANQSANQIIYGPGEYNIKNTDITGIALQKESSENFLKTVYLANIENISLCFFGHISEMPEPTVLEHLEKVDILFIPAGGEPFISQKLAAKTIKQIAPKIIIPSFYKIPGLKRNANDLSVFLEEFNGEKTGQKNTQEKLTIKKKDLENIKKTEIVILSKS